MRAFPVAAEGHPHFADDFAYKKPGATRAHGGIDIFADEGAPIVAVDDGQLTFAEDPKGGHAFYLHATDGTVYYGAHLSEYEGEARPVEAGDVIGYVGHTGNAAETASHLHFEVHPAGGIGVDAFTALSELAAPSVPIPAVRATTNILPPSDGPPEPLGNLIAHAPVPPIPHAAPARRGAGVAVLALGGLATVAFFASRRRV
jgi:murein DD-endopeptidase MepM/ murein hydrolase activator NlpD